MSVDLPDFTPHPADARLLPEPALPARTPPIRYRASIPTSWLTISLHEGKNRQVRKMTAAVGFPTLRLVRWAIGHLTADGMQPAAVRELAPEELTNLLGTSPLPYARAIKNMPIRSRKRR